MNDTCIKLYTALKRKDISFIGSHDVHTPQPLVEEVLSYLPLSNSTILVLFNVEFVISLVYTYNVDPNRITFFTDHTNKSLICTRMNIKYTDTLETDMKFDIIVGNPPYNDNSGNRGSGHTLWTEFVKLAYNKLVKPEGYLVYVHPSGWRQYNHKLRSTMLEKQIVYLEIHDEKDGQRVFKCNTRYDWYVMHNVPYTKKTTIMCQDGVITKQNLTQWNFIPNRAYDRLLELMAKNDSDKINLVYSESAYEGRKAWMSKEPSDIHIYPCVCSAAIAASKELKIGRAHV